MDIIKEIKKQATDIMKDEKKKEQVGDTIENGLKGIKTKVKDKKKKDMIDKAINVVDGATSSKKKNK